MVWIASHSWSLVLRLWHDLHEHPTCGWKNISAHSMRSLQLSSCGTSKKPPMRWGGFWASILSMGSFDAAGSSAETPPPPPPPPPPAVTAESSSVLLASSSLLVFVNFFTRDADDGRKAEEEVGGRAR